MARGTKGLPLYLEIAEKLRTRITATGLKDGDKIPSQRELAAEFSTTLMTVRQALELLEEEELVRTEHGKGMFVSTPSIKEYDRERLFGFDREMGLRHQRIATRLVDAPLAMIYPEVARLLGYEKGRLPSVIRRLRILDGRPIVLQSSYLVSALEHLVPLYDPAESLYEQIAAQGCGIVAMTREILLPVALDAAAAGLLARRVGEPAMLSARMSRTSEGEALVYDEAIIAGDSFFMSAERIGKRHDYDFNFGRGGLSPMVEQYLGED